MSEYGARLELTYFYSLSVSRLGISLDRRRHNKQFMRICILGCRGVTALRDGGNDNNNTFFVWPVKLLYV